MVSGLADALLGRGDHCQVGGGLHHHLCVLHPPAITNHPLAWCLIAATLLPASWVIARAMLSAHEQWRLSRTLVRSSRRSELGNDVRLLEQDEPVALTVGVWRPVVLLSTGLIDMVSARTLRIILMHERAHVRRHDTTWALFDQVTAALLPRSIRGVLMGDLMLARERACDAVAASVEGDVHVAAALVQVARMGLLEPACGVSIGASSLQARVLHLLERPAHGSSWSVWPVVCVLAFAVAGVGPAHAWIEQAIALLIH
jgi:Zn-dependent protease with chaperone function